MWANWTKKAPDTTEESIKELRDMAEALYDDNQRLIELTQAQAEQIVALSRQVKVAFFILAILAIAVIYLSFKGH